MGIDFIVKAMQVPVDAVHGLVTGRIKAGSMAGKDGAKTVQVKPKEVESAQAQQQVAKGDSQDGKVWATSDKIADIAEKVLSHPVTQRLVKGLVNSTVEKLEMSAMESAVMTLGDKVLPGEVAAAPIALKVIQAVAFLLRM